MFAKRLRLADGGRPSARSTPRGAADVRLVDCGAQPESLTSMSEDSGADDGSEDVDESSDRRRRRTGRVGGVNEIVEGWAVRRADLLEAGSRGGGEYPV